MKYQASFVPKLIYVIRINDSAHKGCLKVGEASVDGDVPITDLKPNCSVLNKSAKKRVNQYTQTAGIAYDLLYTELTIYISGKGVLSFNDKAVHDVLERSGIKKKVFNTEAKADEWFITDLETVKRAIKATREGRSALNQTEITTDRSPVVFRPEQSEAIKKTVKQFKKNKHMLWNAKMRFGKTLSALQVVREMEYTRTLILTHRPVVNSGWYDDFQKIFYDRADFSYGSRVSGETFESLEKAVAKKGIHYVYFASMQDLRGSEIAGGKFDKNDELFSAQWDLIIIDEAHEGTQTELGQNVLKELDKKETRILQLSGTPFNLLDQYQESEIYTWDYVMEQRAKAEWDKLHFGDPNPYAALPRLNIYTFDLGERFEDFKDSELAFNFHEFFRVNEAGEFVHKKSVAAFLDLICSSSAESNYPFSKPEYRDNFRHSFWRIPGVKEGRALSAMLKAHPVFGQFEIVNVAGEGDDDEENEEALKMVRAAIEKNDYTITLSCGRLTTGVTVPEWTAVFMLAGSFNTSASSYMQTIFRCQSPATIAGKVKEECFVFDFAPDRTLKVLAETAKISAKVGKTTGTDRQQMGEFLNFCPVISCKGTVMSEYNADRLLGQLKKVYVERVVQHGFDNNYLYNNDLMYQLTGADISEFDGLKAIIGQTPALHKTSSFDINGQGFKDEQYGTDGDDDTGTKKKPKKEETPAQKAERKERERKKKQRDTAISILRGISIRMPLMIYGAELKNESQEITIDNFASLIDESSWEEFMPRGVTKALFATFKKYYEPDVFRESGKRIREMARATDALPLEERIERITAIFSYFRNPDKETVLTPWRVVNMHLNDCLGGYTFFDEKFETPLASPRFVDHADVTREVFSPTSRVLEINSKSGLYPLYVAYSIYRARLQDKPAPSVAEQHALWDKVLAENVFVICKTPMAKSITKRTLGGFRKCRINAHYFEDLVSMLRYKSEQFIHKVGRTSYWNIQGGDKDMKFRAVVGNPPYQEETAKQESATNGQAPRANIFHYFQMASDSISDRFVSLIYPAARWIHRSGKGLGQFGLSQINDVHLKQIYFYPDPRDIFAEVAIADGISIVFKDNKKTSNGFDYIYCKGGGKISVYLNNPGENLIPLNPQNQLIIDKVSAFVNARKLSWLHERILPRTLFGIESEFVEKNPDVVREYVPGTVFDVDEEVRLFTNDKAGKSGRAKWYITSKKFIPQRSQKYIQEWQVVVSSANAGGQKRDNQIGIIDNHSAFGRARVALGSFKTEAEAVNFYHYAQASLIKFMFLMTDESLTSLGKRVPDILDYSPENGWLDFSKDISAQLCALIGLTAEEIAFIESTIKPME